MTERIKNLETDDNTKNFDFGIEITTAIKGVAICIMMFHHFFGFSDWMENGIDFWGIPCGASTIEYYIAFSGKLCISIYTLLSGYGLYISFSKMKSVWNYKYILQKSLLLLINWYLILILIQIPISCIFGNFCGVSELMSGFLSFSMQQNPFVGYLRFYLVALFTFPVLYLSVKTFKYNVLLILSLPFISIVLRKIVVAFIGGGNILTTYLLYIPWMITGMILCKCKYYDKVYSFLATIKHQKLLMLITIIIVILIRQKLSISFDGWLSVVLVFCIAVLFQDSVKVKKVFRFLGMHSTNLWYSHAVLIFCGVVMQKILYAPKIPILILMWGILLCLPFSCIVNILIKKIKKVFQVVW